MLENQIAFCGLYCEECPFYKGKIADLARDLRKELRDTKFSNIAEGLPFKEFKNYDLCYEVLGALVKIRCKSACRKGGGNPFCAIRKCSQKKNFQGCWECDDIETCKKLDTLKAGHGDAHIKNLRKIKKKGIDNFLEGPIHWYSKIKK